MKYCTRCLLPSTKPDLKFDPNGVCAACTAYESRPLIEWTTRKNEFIELVHKYSTRKNSGYDCIIPVSGGKDSTFQVIKILELGFKPLCVTATTCELTEIGRTNIENIKNLGVDHLEFSPNPVIRKKLNKIGLETVGDISWPEHVGIFTIPVRAAVQFKVPLIIWGENSQNEYGGPATSQQSPFLDRRWLEEFGGLLGLRVSDLSDAFGIPSIDLISYLYPTDEALQAEGVTGLFLGHYFPWDGITNYLVAQSHGFNSHGVVIEGSMVDYENIDNYQSGIHDYFKYLKFGFGRATDLASTHIRRGRLTREEGLTIVKLRDGMYPSSYLGKPLSDILANVNLTEPEFDLICDRFTNRSLFEIDSSGNLKRDLNRRPIKLKYDN
jgi:N-acetyl sugar amidotransferase